MTQEERNALTLSLLAHVTPILRRSASAYHLDYDDMYQDASIIIMLMLDNQEVDFTRETALYYVRTRIKSRIVNMLQYALRRRSVSLDAQLSQDDGDGLTLGDLLEAPSQDEPQAQVSAQDDLREIIAQIPARLHPSTARKVRELQDTALACLVG